MDAKESALRKIDALLKLGRPDPFKGVPNDDIKPERMAKLKARCTAIAPFRETISTKGKVITFEKVITLARIQGHVVELAVGRLVSEKSEKELLKKLLHDGYVARASEATVGKATPFEKYRITDPGRRFLDEQMQDPQIAELVNRILQK